MSTERVDVLAVIEEYAVAMDNVNQSHNAAELREASAAVAELIEAAGDGYPDHDNGGPALYFNAQKAARLRTALARIGAP